MGSVLIPVSQMKKLRLSDLPKARKVLLGAKGSVKPSHLTPDVERDVGSIWSEYPQVLRAAGLSQHPLAEHPFLPPLALLTKSA